MGGGCCMSMWSHAYRCVCVCVCVSEKDLDERLCVYVRAHERVHHNEKTKLQPQQAIPVILLGISSKHNAKENST